MDDVSRHLPLSQRSGVDESGATADRRADIARVRERHAELVAGAQPDGSSEPERAAQAGRTVQAERSVQPEHSVQAERSVQPEWAAQPERAAQLEGAVQAERAAQLRAEADGIRRGPRRPMRDLVAAVRELAADAGDAPLGLPAHITGAVALYQVGRAPFQRRAVVKGHTLRASDAGWEFGRGPVLEGTADDIVRFLLGLGDEPPRRVSSR